LSLNSSVKPIRHSPHVANDHLNVWMALLPSISKHWVFWAKITPKLKISFYLIYTFKTSKWCESKRLGSGCKICKRTRYHEPYIFASYVIIQWSARLAEVVRESIQIQINILCFADNQIILIGHWRLKNSGGHRCFKETKLFLNSLTVLIRIEIKFHHHNDLNYSIAPLNN